MSISNSARSRVVGIDVEFRNFNVGKAEFLGQRIYMIGQGNTASTYTSQKTTVLSSTQVADLVGYGSPLHLASRQLLPDNNDGIKGIPITMYPLQDSGTGVVADGEITASGTATAAGSGTVKVGGIESAQIAIADTTTADAALGLVKTAIDAVLNMPVTTGVVLAGVLPLDAKWLGESGNDISIDVSGLDVDGLTFGTTAFSNGANNPDVSPALTAIGDVWETMILNLLNYDDQTTIGLYATYGEGRWDQLVKKPLLVANGTADNFATRTAITDATANKDDRTNFLVTSVGSDELPFVIAARGVSRIAQTANENPPQNYRQTLDGITTGTDAEQENETVRDNAIKLGSSTNTKISDKAKLHDTVTYYHPDGQTDPPYRYVVDVVKLQNVVYNCRLIFEADDWQGAPLLPDATPTNNPTAKKPKNAISALKNLADSLGLAAIISDPEFTKSNITASIDSQNPKRLNWEFPVKLSGNTEIISGDVYFGFYLGS